ncbi:signal peptidase I [Streptomyces sp. NPDC002490]|uniref:signal peptidase I n=1 Tax=Streptomyces sp. NPDC002490 TaxID=3154416 RepID=UPI00331FCD6C
MISGAAVALGSVLFLGAAVWGAVVYRPYTVPTPSMAPTVEAGDRLLAQRIDGDRVRRGDVVVFSHPDWSDLPLVKRVVAVSGDTVACCADGRLTVNGTALDEPYLPAGRPAAVTSLPSTVVPAGRLFLLGDARGGSLDSAARLRDGDGGTVPGDAVVARVDAVVWPPATLARPAAFAALPGGVSAPGPLRPLTASALVGAVLVFGGAAHGPLARRLAARRTG